MLDQRFFELAGTRDHKGSVLESYKAVHARSTMVLFSRKTRTPLAALTLKANDVGCLGMLTGRPAPDRATEPYFQGMLNMPDQPFTFTISNLSNQGMINFNVLHTPHRVSQVDPGPAYGINQVNELRTNQSYTIQADQRNKRQMILTGKIKTVQDPETSEEKQVPVTVKESEGKEKPTGLYFYLSVVPDKACKQLVDKFAEGTAWKVTHGFVRRVSKPTLPGIVCRAQDEYDYLVKIILIGDYKVGKTSLSTRFVNDEFNLETNPTIGVDFLIKRVQVEGKTIKIQVWDMSGEERFRALCAPYCRGAHGIIIVYDVTNAESFNNVNWWLHASEPYAWENAVKLLVGNKCDLGQLRAVETDKAMSFSQQNNLAFVETSALDGTGVDTAFQRITTEISHRLGRIVQHHRSYPAISLGATGPPTQRATASLRGAASSFQGMAASLRRAMPFQARAHTSAAREAPRGVGSAEAFVQREAQRTSVVTGVPRASISESGTRFVEPVNVGSTQAAELNYGSQVEVRSSNTGHDYAYEHCSEPTVLCMSIWKDMKFLGLSNIEEELAEEVAEWVKNEGKALIESLNAIFKADTCVIDLESDADTIVCTCGHQCINHANVVNLRKCPLCRSPITAFVRADGIVVE